MLRELLWCQQRTDLTAMVVVCEVNNLSLFILPNFSRLFDPGSDL